MPLQYPPMVYLACASRGSRSRRGPRGRAPAEASAERGRRAPPARRRPVFGGSAPTWLLVTLLAVDAGAALRPQRLRLERHRRRLCGRDRRRPHHPRRDALRHHAERLLHLRHLRPAQLHRLRARSSSPSPGTGTWDSLPRRARRGHPLRPPLHRRACWCWAGARPGCGWGSGLALAWSAFPFTAYALETQLQRLPGRGDADLGAGGGATSTRPRPDAGPRARPPSSPPRCCCRCGAASRSRGPGPGGNLLPYVAGPRAWPWSLTGWVLLLDGPDGMRRLLVAHDRLPDRADSPFSLWGQYPGLRPVQIGLMVVVALAAVAVLRWPRRLDLLTMTALSGALLIGLELTADPLVLPLHPLVPAVRPRRDGARLAAARPRTPRTAPGARARAPAREPLPVAA